MGSRGKALRWLVLVGSLGVGGACGYSLQGQGAGALAPDIRVVAVPPVEGVLPRAEIQQKLTQHIVNALVARTHRRIQSDVQGADAVLKLEVQAFQVTPVGWSAQGQATTFQVLISLRVRLYRTSNEAVLFENPGWVFRNQFTLPGTGAYTDPEVQAIDELGQVLAQALVSAVVEAF